MKKSDEHLIDGKFFKKTLRERRRKYGLTQQQLADRANIPRTSLAYFECGDRLPSLVQAYKLAQVLQIGVTKLLPFVSGA